MMKTKVGDRRQSDHARSGIRVLSYLLALCLLAGGGCSVLRETAKLPGRTVAAVVPGVESKQADPGALQSQLLRCADDFFSRTATGIEDYSRRINTPEARREALEWRIALHSSVLGIVTGPEPMASLMDFLALASLTRSALEERAANPANQGAFDPWLQTARIFETNIWSTTENFLTASQRQEFQAAIDRWLSENTTTRAAFFSRPAELAASVRLNHEKNSPPGSVFSLVGLDPMAGLDPAVREVTRTRLFAERALFAVEHMPFLLRWQTEAFTLQLLDQKELTNTVASVDRLSRAAESASQTAALLPDRISAERKAILDTMEAQEGKLRELSAEVGRTLAAGDKMSTSLNTTIITFDALMKRFGVGEPDTTPANTNSTPFNILDYAKTAEQVAKMAQELDLLIKDTSGTVDAPALDKRIASLKTLATQTRADAKSVLNHGFLLAAGLIVLTFVCAVVYRRVSAKH